MPSFVKGQMAHRSKLNVHSVNKEHLPSFAKVFNSIKAVNKI